MELEQAIRHALDGDALLFLGSGFSIGATPVKGNAFLTGRLLARSLYKDAGVETDDDQLNYAADAFLRSHSPERLIEILKETCVASEISGAHETFATVPWKAIFTTNYDNILELAYKKKGIDLHPITPESDSSEFTSKNPSCVHINGYALTAKASDLGSNLKLTNTSYLTEALGLSNWGFLFKNAIENSKAVIFVGYSMYDLDIQRIIGNYIRDVTIWRC